MLAVLRDGFGDSSTAVAPALRMTGGEVRLEWGIRMYSVAFECVRLRKREHLPCDGACLGEGGRWRLGDTSSVNCVDTFRLKGKASWNGRYAQSGFVDFSRVCVPWWEWGGGVRTIPQSALQTAPFTQGRLDKERTE